MLGAMNTVGGNIRRLRLAAGVATQRDFARMLGVESTRVNDWENDRYAVIELPNLLKIAKVLRVSLDDILAGTDAEYDAVLSTRDLPSHADMIEPRAEDHDGSEQIGTQQARYNHLRNDMQGIFNAMFEVLAAHEPASSGVPATFKKVG